MWDAERVACISYVGYNYIQRSSSITNAFRPNVLDLIDSICRREDFYEAHDVPLTVRYKDIIRGYYQMYAVFEHADFRHEPFKSKIREQNRELRKRNRRLRRYPLSITQKARLAINAVSPYYTWRIMGF